MSRLVIALLLAAGAAGAAGASFLFACTLEPPHEAAVKPRAATRASAAVVLNRLREIIAFISSYFYPCGA